jgi:hypothetical protein
LLCQSLFGWFIQVRPLQLRDELYAYGAWLGLLHQVLHTVTLHIRDRQQATGTGRSVIKGGSMRKPQIVVCAALQQSLPVRFGMLRRRQGAVGEGGGWGWCAAAMSPAGYPFTAEMCTLDISFFAMQLQPPPC